MKNTNLSPRFFNPLMLWSDVAVKTGEMLTSSASVIQMRTQRMAEHGMQPTPADMREMQLMGQEKLEAATESGTAILKQLQATQQSLMTRGFQQWLASVNAWVALVTSTTPAQAMTRGQAFFDALTRAAGTATQLSSAGARIAQRGLKPIHDKASANAARLSNNEAAAAPEAS